MAGRPGELLDRFLARLIDGGIQNDPVRRQAWHDRFAGGTAVVKIG